MRYPDNLYESLELPKYASVEEVKSAFRRLAVRFHPDKNPGDVMAEEKFKVISAAYEVLGHQPEKQRYDNYLRGYGLEEFLKSATSEKTKEQQRKERVKEILRKRREKEEKDILEAYENQKATFSYKYRYILFALLLFTGLRLIFINSFLREYDDNFFLVIGGIAIVLAANFFLFNSLFKKWNAAFVQKRSRQEPALRTFYSFVISLFISLSVAFTASSNYKSYQLANHSGSTLGVVIFKYDANTLNLAYRVNGKDYVKKYRMTEEEAMYFNIVERDVIQLRYAIENPRICEITGVYNSER